jgi:hypothetical protein
VEQTSILASKGKTKKRRKKEKLEALKIRY